jgi:hypothetical protein
MLLVTFHGGTDTGSINNVYAYNTSDASLLTAAALAAPSGGLSELRAMVLSGEYLYVCNGAKSISNVLVYSPPQSGASFSYVATLIAATLSSKGHFETSIAHPFGLAFCTCGGSALSYVSNQDTNVVAQVAMGSNGQSGSLGTGCQSLYLTKAFPTGTFLDGTFAASENGDLHDVSVTATNVPSDQGGLDVTFNGDKVQNSVRDVAIANGILFVCNEPHQRVNMYSLPDGTYLGHGDLDSNPTHLAIQNGGLWVSAGESLYWGQLPASSTGASLSLQTVSLGSSAPSGDKIGGLSFNNGGSSPVLYIPFQAGTSGAYGGSIYTHTVTQSSPSSAPTLSNGAVFVASGSSTFEDTPEFVLYVP